MIAFTLGGVYARREIEQEPRQRPASGRCVARRQAGTSTPRFACSSPARKFHHSPLVAVVAFIISAACGVLVGVAPSLALFSHSASATLGTVTAGNLDVTLDSTYNWTLQTPAIGSTAGQTITGGPASAATIPNLWVADNTTVTLAYTGEIQLVGDNIAANVVVTPVVAGTSLAQALGNAAISTAVTYTLTVTNSSGATVSSSNLTAGSYTFALSVVINPTGLTHAPRFGSTASNWTFTIGYPSVSLQQVRS